jgi:hypothetical protein
MEPTARGNPLENSLRRRGACGADFYIYLNPPDLGEGLSLLEFLLLFFLVPLASVVLFTWIFLRPELLEDP